jgi:hypothetical protein
MIQENVMYAELRPMLLDKNIPSTDGKSVFSNFQQMQLIIDGVKEKQAALRKEGRGDKFPYGLKIIYCTPRSIPKDLMQEELKQCIELKMRYPKLICGKCLPVANEISILTCYRLRSGRRRRPAEPHRLLQRGAPRLSKDM